MLLNERWALGDVDDVERLARTVLLAETQKRGVVLRSHDLEDLYAYGIEVVWDAWERYDPGRGLKFSTFARQQLKLRYLDYVRKVRGRTRWRWANGVTYEREPRPLDLSLEGSADDDSGRPLGETLVDGSSDFTAGGGSSPLGELLADRDRESPWDQALVRAAARRLAGDGAVRDRHRAA